MSKTHIHQVTPMHKGKSNSFFANDDDTNPSGEGMNVRDVMGGIFEEEDTGGDEDKMYAHELPPDPFMQQHSIAEDDEEEDDYGDDDFLDESQTSAASGGSKQLCISTDLVSPINMKSSATPLSPSKKPNNTSNLLKEANSNIDALIDKVSTVTHDYPVTSSSEPVIATTTPPRPHSKHLPINNNPNASPRAHSRSPRSVSSTNSKRTHSAQKLRQSPIRVQSQEPDIITSLVPPAAIVSSIAKSPTKMSMGSEYNDDDFDFDYEDDFGGESEHESPKKVKKPSFGEKMSSPSKKASMKEKVTVMEDDNDDLYETLDPLKEVNTEGEQSSNLIEGKIEGMTLESYMEEYTKVKELDDGFQNTGGDGDDVSPPVVDPQGLDGCSPGPGQRHINGTNSPFRIDSREFGQDFEVEQGEDEYPDDDHLDQQADSQNGEILATILTQMQDVQSKLEVLSTSQNVSPVKSKGILKKGVSFSGDTDGKGKHGGGKNKAKNSVQHSPIEHQKDGHMSISDKVASGVHSSLKHQNKDKHANVEQDDVDGSHDLKNQPPLEVKVDVLKKQLRKRTDDAKKMEDRMKRMEKEMEDMHNKWKDAESEVTAANKKINKSNKAKLTAQKKVAEMSQEMVHYESLIEAVEQLRENEAILLKKVKHLEEQNIETSKALKASMSRELEWRALYKKEHAADGHFGNNNNNHSNHGGAGPRASSGMNSHRSLPDQERAHVRQSQNRALYERNSITEGRQKKKKKKPSGGQDGNNRQKILPILISKQRK